MRNKDRTESIWEKVELPQYPILSQNEKSATCIIGGGIAGVSLAYQMAKRGHEVTLVEAFRIGSGQTGRTTAHLTCQLEEQFLNLLKIHDQDTVQNFLNAHRTAIDVIEQICQVENISCDFKRVDGYLFQGQNFSQDDLEKEQKAASKCGIDLDFVDVTPLLSDTVSSLRFPRQAQFNPLKYLQGLLRVLNELDVNVYEGTHINDISQDQNEQWILKSDTGYQIEARHLIVATDSPVNNRFHIHTKQYPYRSYAMAFHLSTQVKEECLLWDTEDPYHYIRFVENTLVVGGADHHVGEAPEADPFKALEEWSRKNFSFIKDIAWKWSGQVFEPMDQIAFIGRNPGNEKNVYISTGSSGIGMTSGTIASMIIPDLIEKGDHPWAKTFDPSRPPIRGIKDFIQENINVAFQYSDWIRPPEATKQESIPVDSGALMQEGVLKSCVYHGEGDTFEKKSAICSHLGGIVHWNEIEKTWDCPCHGSRFNTKGQVIEGPAISGLMEK